jgi:hypothetical protein
MGDLLYLAGSQSVSGKIEDVPKEVELFLEAHKGNISNLDILVAGEDVLQREKFGIWTVPLVFEYHADYTKDIRPSSYDLSVPANILVHYFDDDDEFLHPMIEGQMLEEPVNPIHKAIGKGKKQADHCYRVLAGEVEVNLWQKLPPNLDWDHLYKPGNKDNIIKFK